MNKLISQLNTATKESRGLDIKMWEWINNELVKYGSGNVNPILLTKVPHYTTSIDAALTLVPEGWSLYHLDTFGGGGYCEVTPSDGDESDCINGQASTPALALCIAALKAKEKNDE